MDRKLFVFTVALTLLGLLAVADASAPQAFRVFQDPLFFVKQQAVWALVGLVGMLAVSFVDYRLWRRLAFVVFLVNLVLLVIVLVPGLGVKVLGARRWLDLGPISFQPSEFMKLSVTLFMARLADGEYPYWISIASVGLVAGLIMFQPDLGTTIMIVAIAGAQFFVMGMPVYILGGLGVLGALAAGILVLGSDYRRERLATFLEGTTDPLGSSYHIRQILIALGSGGLLGVGIGQSRQKHLFLPETATDSVFAVIAEEVGFIGASLVIIVLTFYTLRIIKLSQRAPDRFSKVFVAGVAFWIGGQSFLNIGSMVALTPLTGMPLPFFSYGGSSLTMMLIAIGILLSISRHAKA